MMKKNTSGRPALVTFALYAAWLDWLLVSGLTVATTSRPELLGVALPTLGTQALLLVGVGWGSNVARMSFYIWSVFAVILSGTGGEVGSDGSALAAWGGHVSSGLTFVTLISLLMPAANRWYLEQRQLNQNAAPAAKRERALRNLKVAVAWLLVLPVSALIAVPLDTPFLAVFLSCVVAIFVGVSQVLRQSIKLYRLRD
jgi:hypothetical protein